MILFALGFLAGIVATLLFAWILGRPKPDTEFLNVQQELQDELESIPPEYREVVERAMQPEGTPDFSTLNTSIEPQ